MSEQGNSSVAQRLREFKQMAAEARKAAGRAATPEMRRGYEQLAQSWDQLIREIESR